MQRYMSMEAKLKDLAKDNPERQKYYFKKKKESSKEKQ